MTIHLSIVLFLPLATGVVGAFLPRGIGRWIVLLGTVAVLAYVVAMIADFAGGTTGLQYVTDDDWISELGIRYQLGVDGLNLFLVALTALAWVPCTLVSCFRVPDRPRLFFFHLALAETAVLGAFMAQDLALFVVFFDLMLVPFYFLIGGWGTGDRVRATTKFVIYTLVGSLLMLAGRGGAGRAVHARGRQHLLLARRAAAAHAGRGHPGVDLPAVRGRVPRQGAAVPAARLGAGDLPRHADPGAGAALRRALEGGRLRLPADRAADPARRLRTTSRT